MNLNVVFAVDNNGFEMMAVALYSVIRNNQGHLLSFYVFHKNISSMNTSRLKKLEKTFPNVQIKVIAVDKNRFKGIDVNNKNVTTEAYFRYLAPEILRDEHRALYMDFDMMCISDLEELYSIDLGDSCIGAVADYVVENSHTFYGYKEGIGFNKNEKYANSGLLLLDLDALRKGNIMEVFWSNARNKHKIIPKELNFFADQTVMNLSFKGKIQFLDAKYNVFTTTLKDTKQKNPSIIHFTGTHKPLTYRNQYTVPYDEMYYKYYRECLGIIGDDNGSLIKGILKKQTGEINDKLEEIDSKNHQLEQLRAHIRDIEARLLAQDAIMHAQNSQLNSVTSSQKRAIKLALKKFNRIRTREDKR